MFVFYCVVMVCTVRYIILVHFVGIKFCGFWFLSMIIYEVLYPWCLRYNICSTCMAFRYKNINLQLVYTCVYLHISTYICVYIYCRIPIYQYILCIPVYNNYKPQWHSFHFSYKLQPYANMCILVHRCTKKVSRKHGLNPCHYCQYSQTVFCG